MILQKNKETILAIKTDDGKHRVFVYGSLKNNKSEKDVVDGQMRLMKNGWAIVRFDEPGIVHGEIHEVDDATLKLYDSKKQEGTEYERIIIKTKFNVVCCAYQYREKSRFMQHELIKNGEWDESMIPFHVKK